MYKVVVAGTAEELEQEVNALINDGWKPSGGVSVTYLPIEVIWRSKYQYCQAMVKG